MEVTKTWLDRMGRFFSLLFEVAKGVSALLAILTILGVLSIAAGANSKSLSTIVIGGVISIVSIGLAIYIYILFERISVLESQLREVKVTNYKPLIEVGSPSDYPVKVLLKEIEYGYKDDLQTMWQKKRFIVEALHDNISGFPDRYVWTGTPGTLKVTTRTPGYKVTNERREEYWNYYDVSFPFPLKKGQKADFVVEWELFDEKKTAIPFLSTPVDFPMNQLKLRVVLPPSKRPVKATAQRFKTYIDQVPVEASELEYNTSSQSLDYEVSTPELGSKYLIRWWFE